MENENNVNLDTPNEEVAETVETPATEATDDTLETPEVDVEQLQATNKRLFERAKKAEAELKASKANSNTPAKTTSPASSIEETVILDKWAERGVPNAEMLMEQLKKVASLNGISILKAQTDTLFVAVKEKFEKEQKQKDSFLPVSRGSGAVKAKKSFNTPGLSRDEHKKMIESL